MQSYGVCVIEGNIGVGKSTLCEKLVKVTNGEGVYELDEKNNPFLEKYYKDPQRWAFAMQINLLSSRYRSHMMAQSKVMYDRKTWCFMDRSYFGDACFARVQQELGLWTTEEYEAYFKLHKDMQNHIYYPTAAIFLNCDVENCIRRINKRMSEKAGRVCESTIKPDYLLALDKEINELKKELKKRGVTIVEYDWNDDKTEAELEECAKNIFSDILLNMPPVFHETWTGCGGFVV